MKKLLVAQLLFSTSGPLTAEEAPQSVDPALAVVSTQANARILVYSVCSPEHCWSETYLQVLSADEPKVLCTSKVKEIFVGHVVNDVSWSFVHGAPRAQLKVSASHGGFKPYTVTLIPLDGCEYSLAGAAVGS